MGRSVPARTFTGWEQLDDPVEEEVLISLYGFAHTASNGPQAPQVTTVTPLIQHLESALDSIRKSLARLDRVTTKRSGGS